jgi:hypothetical protein
MRRDDAKEFILSAWLKWNEHLAEADLIPRAGTAMHLFYEFLQARHPQALDFASYNPYLQIRQWLAEDCEP